jgi:hypothetical protein
MQLAEGSEIKYTCGNRREVRPVPGQGIPLQSRRI